MTQTRYPRPCPIPGHPQDEDEPALVTESAWARLRAWHLHAPAERLPLPLVLTHLAGRVGPARRARAGPRRHLRRRRRRGGVLADVAPPRAQLPAPAAAPDRGRSRRRGYRRLDRRRRRVGAARLARAPADLDLPGWRDRRVRLAAQARGRPGRPPAPRGRSRLDGAESRMAPDRAPDRPGRLPPAGGRHDAPGRGTAAHQRAGQRAGHPRRGEQQAVCGEVRAPAGPALRPGRYQAHRVPGPAGHRSPREGPVGQRPGHPPGAGPGLRRSTAGSPSTAASATLSPSG